RAQQAHQRSEILQRAILDSAIDCIISMDQTGRIIEFNPATETVLGYTRAEALGKRLAELMVPPRLRAQHERGLAHYLETGEGPVLGKRIEMPAMRADGSEVPVELSITAFELAGQTIFTACLRDITERKQ